MSETLVQLFKHHAWANDRLFGACERLDDAQLDAALTGTFGSIRDTLVHIVGAQERFVAALSEASAATKRERQPFPGVAALREAVRASDATLIDLAGREQPGATVTTVDRGTSYTLPAWLLFLQAINHATEHRTQVAAILTQQGIDPPSMDGWTYDEDRFDADWSQLWSS